MLTTSIQVTKFKPSGKYSYTFSLSVTIASWYDITEEVRKHKDDEGSWLIGMDNSRDDMYPVLIH